MDNRRVQSGRGRMSKKKFMLYMIVAALFGVGIGILIGVLLAKHENRQAEPVVQEVIETGSQSISESAEGAGGAKEKEAAGETEGEEGTAGTEKAGTEGTEGSGEASDQEGAESTGSEAAEIPELTDADAYEVFLQEAAEEKNVSAANVDLLVVAGEIYSELFNSTYPKHDYNLGAFVWGEDDRMTYTENKVYRTRTGIDVSEFNGDIDWEKVKDDGIEFVFIRMGFRGYGEGDIYEDATFAANLAGAQEAGLDVGIYFFAQAVSEEEAEEEAQYVIDRLGGTELQMPIVYDVEPIRTDDARTDKVTGKQFTKNTAAFCRKIEENGYEAGYYANLKWEVFMLDMRDLTDYTMWYAGYADQPQTAYDFSIWQYTDQGAVDGVPTNVDMDLQLIPVTPEEAAAIEAAEKKAAEEAAKAAEEEAKRAEEEAKRAEKEAKKAAEEAEQESGEEDAEEVPQEPPVEEETGQEPVPEAEA